MIPPYYLLTGHLGWARLGLRKRLALFWLGLGFARVGSVHGWVGVRDGFGIGFGIGFGWGWGSLSSFCEGLGLGFVGLLSALPSVGWALGWLGLGFELWLGLGLGLWDGLGFGFSSFFLPSSSHLGVLTTLLLLLHSTHFCC